MPERIVFEDGGSKPVRINRGERRLGVRTYCIPWADPHIMKLYAKLSASVLDIRIPAAVVVSDMDLLLMGIISV
jgi:hypothetical protein